MITPLDIKKDKRDAVLVRYLLNGIMTLIFLVVTIN
jgi:hypothetical protein